MIYFDCPSCGSAKARRLIAGDKALQCNECYEAKRDRNTHIGEKGGDWGKMSYGKAWEIDQRIASPDDGKTIINRKTGKPTQY